MRHQDVSTNWWNKNNFSAGNLRCNGESTIERRKRGFIKEGVGAVRSMVKSPLLRLLRVRTAKKVLLTDAKLYHTDELLNVYRKSGGRERAERDFWLLNAYDVKEGYAMESGGVWKRGMVGDYVVHFEQRYSEEYPYPSILMYRRASRERSIGPVLNVLYISLN